MSKPRRRFSPWIWGEVRRSGGPDFGSGTACCCDRLGTSGGLKNPRRLVDELGPSSEQAPVPTNPFTACIRVQETLEIREASYATLHRTYRYPLLSLTKPPPARHPHAPSINETPDSTRDKKDNLVETWASGARSSTVGHLACDSQSARCQHGISKVGGPTPTSPPPRPRTESGLCVRRQLPKSPSLRNCHLQCLEKR